jgi:hypothetical protein
LEVAEQHVFDDFGAELRERRRIDAAQCRGQRANRGLGPVHVFQRRRQLVERLGRPPGGRVLAELGDRCSDIACQRGDRRRVPADELLRAPTKFVEQIEHRRRVARERLQSDEQFADQIFLEVGAHGRCPSSH